MLQGISRSSSSDILPAAPFDVFVKAIAPVVARLPAFPASVLLATGMNIALSDSLPGLLGPLIGKTVRIAATDLELAFDLAITTHGFAASCTRPAPVVTISASARDFVRLARREEDPDTLFFARRLIIEGDTELGLLLKNQLGALDLRVVLGIPPSPYRLFSALCTSLQELHICNRTAR